MKRFFSLLTVVMIATATFAQSAVELAKQQKELNNISMKMLKMKPTKSAKKQAKVLKKEGWSVPAGEKSIEQQITESQLIGAELMKDENGATVKRFILQTAIQVAGTYNAGYAAARSNAQTELASMLTTQIVAAMQSKLDNSQSSSITAVTVDKFNERAKQIVDGTLTNSMPVVSIYRRLENGNVEVQVRMAFDKKEISSRLKRNMQKELEAEGDKLNSIVDEVIENKL